MSAFIVDEYTMHRALMGFDFGCGNGRGTPDAEEMTKLGRRWYEMNRQAVEARYGKEHGFDVPTYTFKRIPPRNPLDYIKALQCLRYQCSEGNVPETREFQGLTDALYAAMSRIIRTLPAYEMAPWDGEKTLSDRRLSA